MLPAERRVRRPADFTASVRDGRRVGGSGLVVHVGTTPTNRPARVGFVVSKAVGGSVVRNRVRRQLRHLIGPRLLTLPSGTDLVVRVMPAAAAMSRRELTATAGSVLDRVQRSVVSA